MSEQDVRVSQEWLALREPADGEARARDLVEHIARQAPSTGSWLIHDLGSGTGAMGRWLAPQLPGRQHWVLHDRDGDLLDLAAADGPGPAADGATVTMETSLSDISKLAVSDLSGASLITASALLDMFIEDELADLLTVCAAAGCPSLLTLSVAGHVDLTPADPLDRRVAHAFDDHQRRMTDRGRLLGPDAVPFAMRQCGGMGAEVLVRSSPWRLGASHAALTAEWFAGWIRAACEQDVELEAEARDYPRRRQAQLAAGQLAVVVDHADLLILPR